MSDGAVFSGSLSQLDLSCAAIEGSVDVAKIRYLLKEAANVKDLHSKKIGTIIVNSSTWGGTAADQKMQRANKDGEVAALCFLLFWESKEDGGADSEVMKRLTEAARDLTFKCKALGSGSMFESQKMLIIEEEEQPGNVIGVSAWR